MAPINLSIKPAVIKSSSSSSVRSTKLFKTKTSLFITACFATLVTFGASAETVLKVYAGGSGQRPDLMKKLFEQYEAQHPDIKIEIETGGATSDLQRQYLSTVLNAKDSTLDMFMIDIVNPAQYMSAGWVEPLNVYVGEPDEAFASFLPTYKSANVVDGKIAAMPLFADSMFMYYRKDLLEKYGHKTPQTWQELAAIAKDIQQKEGNTELQGLSIQGAPIEGAVCTFLMPYWSQGKEFTDDKGKLTLDTPAATASLQLWRNLMDEGVVKKNIAEVKTSDTVSEFKAGKVIFGVNWGFAWNQLMTDDDSTVKGNVGVISIPAMENGQSATCLGGWQWAVSAFSTHKTETADLAKFMSSPEASAFLAKEGSLLPTQVSVYDNPDVLAAVPWFADAKKVIVNAKSRPQSTDYAQVSDVIRTNTSAALAGTMTPEQAVEQIEKRLKRVMR